MIPLESSLRQLFHDVVSECYDARLGLRDSEISSYVADLLTEFCRADNIYRIRDAAGNPVRQVGEMLLASDPVHGTASSFGEERERRKHIGDYTLFFAGMYPEATNYWGDRQRDGFFRDGPGRQGELLHRLPIRPFRICPRGSGFSAGYRVPLRPASTA